MAEKTITNVRLLSVPLTSDLMHTLAFEDTTAQVDYFLGRVVHKMEDCTYQRKEGIIRVNKHIDWLMSNGINYVMYQNTYYNNKWFYAFITNMEYRNDGTTWVNIETDVIQTWLFDYTLKPSFIEREHIDNDIVGRNVIPEGLDLGEYISNLKTGTGYAGVSLSVVIGVTESSEGEGFGGRRYHGLYSGIRYYAWENTTENVNDIERFIQAYAEAGKNDAIVCMFMAPSKLCEYGEGHIVISKGEVDMEYINNASMGDLNINHTLSTGKLDTYTPRNKKLLTFPFRYLYADNHNGSNAIYRYEDFYGDDGAIKTVKSPMFQITGCLSPGCSIRMTPMYYRGEMFNHSEGLNMGKYPALNWASDTFTNWLTQNGINIGLSVASGVTSMFTGGPVGVVAGVMSIAQTLGEVHQASLAPPQAEGNINCGDVVTASGTNDIYFYDMSIKYEQAKIIDEYFDMYGYKTHRVKVPNSWHRENYWYTKCIDVNIIGGIPQDDMQKIKDCYNNGITFWKNPETIQDYSISNGTV